MVRMTRLKALLLTASDHCSLRRRVAVAACRGAGAVVGCPERTSHDPNEATVLRPDLIGYRPNRDEIAFQNATCCLHLLRDR